MSKIGTWRKRNDGTGLRGLLNSSPDTLLNFESNARLGVTILQLIRQSKQSLAIVSPMIEGEEIVSALLNAKARKVKVKIITDVRGDRAKSESGRSRGFDLELDDKQRLNRHHNNIRKLAQANVHCRGTAAYPHAKLLIADERDCLVSSANLTPNSIVGGANPSFEAGILVTHESLATELIEFFRFAWRSAPFRMQRQGSDISIQQVGIPAQNQMLPAAQLVFWNDPVSKCHSLRNQLIEMINGARERIVLVAMSFFETNQVDGLHIALEKALGRGVGVEIVVRQEHFAKEEAKGSYPDASTADLLKKGLRLSGIKKLHAKGVVVDHKQLLIMSGNFNHYSLQGISPTDHFEIGILHEASAPDEMLASLLNSMPDFATHEFLLNQPNKRKTTR